MIHYNIWFRFRGDVDEAEGLAIAHTFLAALRAADGVAEFQLLRNCGTGTRTRMLPLQALIEFRDDAQFSSTFSGQAARGIHTGLHGRIMSLVEDFQVEVFRRIGAPDAAPLTAAIAE